MNQTRKPRLLTVVHRFFDKENYGVPISDLTFLLDCDPYTCFQRASSRNNLTGGKHLFPMGSEKISEIRKRHLDLMNERREIKIIDSAKPIEEVSQKLIKNIDNLFLNIFS